MIRKRRLVWHRNRDLRFHDHPFYSRDDAENDTNTNTITTSVFVFDDAFGCGIKPSTCLPGHWKATHLGPHGMRILLESVADLRANSKDRTGQSVPLSQELVVRKGPTVPVLLTMIDELIAADETTNAATDRCCCYHYEVCWNEEPGWHEMELSRAVREALTKRFDAGNDDSNNNNNNNSSSSSSNNNNNNNNNKRVLRIRTAMSCTLYHPEDLPAPGDWQPLSKKEKRRRQKQKRQQNQTQTQIQQNAATKTKNVGIIRTGTAENNNDCVDISLDRWMGMPRIMGDFRKIAREKAGVRPCLEDHSQATPLAESLCTEDVAPLSKIDPGRLPSLEDLLEPLLNYINDDSSYAKQPILGLPSSVVRDVCEHSLRIHRENQATDTDSNANANASNKESNTIRGGETAGLAHLDHFCTNHAFRAQRSLACVDNHQSSRLSHLLAFGCLSPRTVMAAAEKAVASRRSIKEDKDHQQSSEEINDGTWLISHMTMRDFFLYTCLASGHRFYQLEGIPVSQKVAASLEWRSLEPAIKDDEAVEDWTAWATGSTGLPLVDAAMTELLATGYCSNRVRQNAASVLTKDLKLDWRAGAEWFQFLLVDHCVGANWGNWLYFSGVGPDPKNRHFCTVSQAMKYDPDGVYVKKWCPGLPLVGDGRVSEPEHHLRPWDFDPSWKKPLVDPDSQYTWRDLEKLKETGRLLGGE